MKTIIGSLSIGAFLTLGASAFAQTILPSEPPPGQLGSGQTVYVACGPGMARTVTGGADRAGNSRGAGGQQTGGGRSRGPCVKMKGG